MFSRNGRVFVNNRFNGIVEMANDRFARIERGDNLQLYVTRAGLQVLVLPVFGSTLEDAIALVRQDPEITQCAKSSLLHWLYGSAPVGKYDFEYWENEQAYRRCRPPPPVPWFRWDIVVLVTAAILMALLFGLLYHYPAAAVVVTTTTMTTTTVEPTTTTVEPTTTTVEPTTTTVAPTTTTVEPTTTTVAPTTTTVEPTTTTVEPTTTTVAPTTTTTVEPTTTTVEPTTTTTVEPTTTTTVEPTTTTVEPTTTTTVEPTTTTVEPTTTVTTTTVEPTTTTTTTTSPPTTSPYACTPSDSIYVSYEDQFNGPGITYRPPETDPGYNTSLGMMDLGTGAITFIGTMNDVPGNDCGAPMGTCIGNTVRNLYMGPDQQLYGAALPIMESSDVTYLYKIDTGTAQATVVCPLSPFGLLPSSTNIGIDSTGVTYWKVPGPSNFGTLRRINLGTCVITTHIATNFQVAAMTLYYDVLYFINSTGRLLTNTPPSTTIVDTGFDTGVLYGVPVIVGSGDAVDCTADEDCWVPTTFFPYINSAYQTDLRVGTGAMDHSVELFSILYENNGTTSLFLNRSITDTSQIVYGAAPTCYHNISVDIPPLAKRDDMVYAGTPGVLYLSVTGRRGGSALMLYDRARQAMLPVGVLSQTENITKLFMNAGGDLYAAALTPAARLTLNTVTSAQMSLVCTLPVDIVSVFGFDGGIGNVWAQRNDGSVVSVDPVTCTVSNVIASGYTCGDGHGAMLNNTLYCLDTSVVRSVTSTGIVTTLGTHSVVSLTGAFHVFVACSSSSSGLVLTLHHNERLYTVNTATGALSNQEEFPLASRAYNWHPSASSSTCSTT